MCCCWPPLVCYGSVRAESVGRRADGGVSERSRRSDRAKRALRRLELLTTLWWRDDGPRTAELLSPLLSMRSLEECKLLGWVRVDAAEEWYRSCQAAQTMPRLTIFTVKSVN